MRWNIQSVRTDAHVTPDPCFERDDCFMEIIEGSVSLATVFVNKDLPNVSCLVLFLVKVLEIMMNIAEVINSLISL